MRKSFWMIPVALLIAAFGSTPAQADGVDVFDAGGQVTAIDDITLNGSLYNVTFTSTIDNTFSAYPATASGGVIGGITTAIDGTLGDNPINDPASVVYCVATSGSEAVCETYAPPEGWDGDFFIASTAYADSLIAGTPDAYFWANFSPAVVATSEPATAPLTLAGVGLLGLLCVIRKRVAPFVC